MMLQGEGSLHLQSQSTWLVSQHLHPTLYAGGYVEVPGRSALRVESTGTGDVYMTGSVFASVSRSRTVSCVLVRIPRDGHVCRTTDLPLSPMNSSRYRPLMLWRRRPVGCCGPSACI